MARAPETCEVDGAGPAPGSRQVPSTRRALLAGGVGLLGALGALTACGDEEERSSREMWDSLGERPEKYSAEPRVAPDSITPEDRRGLECSPARFVLTASSRRATFEPMDAQVFRGDSEEEPSSPVSAPEGEEFLLCTLDREHFVWDIAAATEPPTARIVVQRPSGEIALPMDVDFIPGSYLMRVAADPAPEDAVLEVSERGKMQRLSLIDGSLVHSDVAHIYGRTQLVGDSWPAGGVEIRGEQSPEADGEEARDAHGTKDRITLLGMSARDMPMARSLGWAPDGEQLLRLEISAVHRVVRAEDGAAVLLPVDLSGSVLRLPDGSEREPVEVDDARHQPDGGSLGETVYLWFSVPVDLTAAEVHLVVIPFPRREGLAEELAASCAMTIPLTLEQPR